jgi:hypothetical protein
MKHEIRWIVLRQERTTDMAEQAVQALRTTKPWPGHTAEKTSVFPRGRSTAHADHPDRSPLRMADAVGDAPRRDPFAIKFGAQRARTSAESTQLFVF